MKKSKALLALLLCAALVLTCLAGCRKKDTDGDNDGPDRGTPAGSREKTPGELLLEAFEATLGDLGERIGGSRLQALVDLADMESVTADFTFGWPDQDGSVAGTISGSAALDRDTGAALIDGDLAEPETDLKLYYAPEFIGLGSDTLFDPGTFYGLRPQGLREQLEGSALAGMVDLDLDILGELDDLLASLPQDTRPKLRDALDRLIALTRDFLRDHEPEIVRQDGQGGYTIAITVTAGELADFAVGVDAILPWFDLSEGIGDIRASEAEMPVTFTLADGKLTHMTVQFRRGEETSAFEADFYGEDGETLTVTLEPYFVLELRLGEDIYMSVSSMSTVLLDWKADGSFDFNMYTTDITDLALVGTMTTGGGKVDFDGIWYRGERGDRNPLTVSIREGGTVTAPETTVNLAEMTERQLYILAMKVLLRFGA